MSLYVIQKCAMTLDGFINDATNARLLISNEADFDRADQVRAECDAILVGAGTIRADDPWLLVRSSERRKQRLGSGRPEHPIKVTLTENGELDPNAHFFSAGTGAKIVYCPEEVARTLTERLGGVAEVVGYGTGAVDIPRMLLDLEERGIGKLLLEAGNTIGTAFLTQGLVNELQISIAPFFVGDPRAPRFVGPGHFYHDQSHRMELLHVERIGDMAFLTYRLKHP